MENAWLDSLSEDWISQPRSGSPAENLPSPRIGGPASGTCNSRGTSSRIPIFDSRRHLDSQNSDSNSLPLGERSLNDNNIRSSHRVLTQPSKLQSDISKSIRGRQLSRTVSVSTVDSVQRPTVHHKSLSASPRKQGGQQQTPEWKRRLLHGDVAYGEQRDLFSSAGLESLFRPPLVQMPSSVEYTTRSELEDITMPSSPPPYPLRGRSRSESPMPPRTQENQQSLGMVGSRSVKFKMVDVGNVPSECDSSRTCGFQLASTASSQAYVKAEGNRVTSGQSDVRHEDLSPIFVSRHNTVDGLIDFAAVELPSVELHQRLQNIETYNERESSQVVEAAHSGNATMDEEELSQIGNYVNLGRGGRSEEGSFRRRMLSPSSLPAIDESAMLREESIQASTPKDMVLGKKQPATKNLEIPGTNTTPLESTQTLNQHLAKEVEHQTRLGSGSPLKLFGTYDTFTNQKLLRRLSQFEDNLQEDCNQVNAPNAPKHGEPGNESTDDTDTNEAYNAASSPSKHSNIPNLALQPPSLASITKFGHGNLNGFEFTEESLDRARVTSDSVLEYAADIVQNETCTRKVLHFQLQPSPVLKWDTATSRQSRHASTMTKERAVTRTFPSHQISARSDSSSPLQVPQQPQNLDTPRKCNGNSEGKRLLHSPPKNPTPKRRRTLHESDIEHRNVEEGFSDVIKESQEQSQSIVGKKRKDARHGDYQEPADPQVMAMRQVLRPRTSTPSQRSSQRRQAAAVEGNQAISNQYARIEQREKIAKVQAELDAPLKGPVVLAAGQAMLNDSRKGSVTTQDFLDEAKKIMAGIRGKARPSSGLASVEEHASDDDRLATPDQVPNPEDSYEESTKEPFSRPPSREGGPLSRPPQKQQNPELLDHLRKYEEMSDLDGVIVSSLKSIRLARDAVEVVNAIERRTDESVNKSSGQEMMQGEAFESDIPNIQITEHPELQRKRKLSTSSASLATYEADFPSHSSNASSEGLTGRSIPTGSSRGSDSKHVIAAHTVSHLIPEQLAGMVFDRERRIWVKRETVGLDTRETIHQTEDTDDDPFGDIPDLTIDETQELHGIKTGASKQREEARISEVQRYQTQLQYAEHSADDIPVVASFTPMYSQTDRRTCSELSHSARVNSRTATEDVGDGITMVRDNGEEPLDDIEQEISINESRVTHRTTPLRRRNITISFSSPLASIIPPDEFDQSVESVTADDVDHSLLARQKARRMSHHSQSRSQSAAPRKMSLGGCTFVARPVSRIDEREEDSLVEQVNDNPLRRSISIVISTPRPTRRHSDHLSIVPSSGSDRFSDGLLQLTPLSEFTLNQPDESFALEASGVDYRHGPGPATTKRSLSLSVKELVQRITDVEPYEPFWEHIKQIQLREKRLQNLHMLSRFCGQLVILDVSGNDIGQLDGAPSTIRHLRIARNQLSDLSTWDHLSNLQYVDISNNHLTTLEGLGNLVHLRGLRADNNKVRSVNGITHLDGLISLRLRDNELQSIDFTGSSLRRLTELDLKGNSIRQVHGLKELHSLATLNLEDNLLDSFGIPKGGVLWALKYLKLGGNSLEELNVEQYPNIRLLYLDRNRLGRVNGLSKTKHLDSLSLRQQREGFYLDTLFLKEAFEVRKLFLSGNMLGNFAPSVDFLNLQYLELANCGLEHLPTSFGQLLSNVRILNLNFNALKDIKPLLGIMRLKKLHLAGNRLFRLRQTTNVLAQFSSLTRVDLRSNPFTLGFYPPILEKRLVIHDEMDNDPEALLVDPFALPDADRAKDTAYTNCLDMGTKMRRRVFEILMLGGCIRLKLLDGLVVDRAGLDTRDTVWEQLVIAGIVCGSVGATHDNGSALRDSEVPQDSGGGNTEVVHENIVEESGSKVPSAEEWPAEDSFA